MFSGCEWSGDYSTRRKRLALRAASDNNCAFTCNPLTPMKLYGIPNCDSVRKARNILDQRGVRYHFIDLRQAPPDETLLRDWLARFGSALINKRSATYRAHKAEVLAAEAAGGDALIALLRALPTLIKRPVIVSDADVWLGLDAPPLQAPRS